MDGAVAGNFTDGFIGGAKSTYNSFTTLTGFASMMFGTVGLASVDLYNGIKKIPQLKAADYKYGAGYVAEKVVEIAILHKVTTAVKLSRGTVSVPEDMMLVRHYTSPEGLAGIQNGGSINASRGAPYGVDVEVQPFTKPSQVQVGQYGRGSYVEFMVPKQQLSSPPGYMGGTGNVGRIITGGQPLNIGGLRPRYVRRNWLGY